MSFLNKFLAPILNQKHLFQEQFSEESLKEIPTETLHLALKEADADTCLWFFEYAEPAQIQGVLDFESWNQDKFDPKHFLQYFNFLALTSPKKVLKNTQGLDDHALIFFLKNYCELDHYDQENPPNLPSNQFLTSPDQSYVIFIDPKNNQFNETLRLWMEKVSLSDINYLRFLFHSIINETKTYSEEVAYKKKKKRLEDLGFMDYHQSIELYSHAPIKLFLDQLETRKFKKNEKFEFHQKNNLEKDVQSSNEYLPVKFFVSKSSTSYFDKVLNNLNPIQKEIIIPEFLKVINMSLCADNQLRASAQTIQKKSMRNKRYLDIALFHLSKGQTQLAQTIISEYPLKDIYHLGWLMFQDLNKAAKKIPQYYDLKTFEDSDRKVINKCLNRHIDIDSESLIKRLSTQTSNSSYEDLLNLGQHLKALFDLGVFYHKTLNDSLDLVKRPLLEKETALKRLITGLFRFSAVKTPQFICTPIKKDEWPDLSKNANLADIKKSFEEIITKCPATLHPSMKDDFKIYFDELSEYMNSLASKKYPDLRFFEALVLEESK